VYDDDSSFLSLQKTADGRPGDHMCRGPQDFRIGLCSYTGFTIHPLARWKILQTLPGPIGVTILVLVLPSIGFRSFPAADGSNKVTN
jgi:hypothetical protein